jgi:hypothetical protein
VQVKSGPGDSSTGSAFRLDRSALPGPVHRFTVSRSGSDSLHEHDAMPMASLSGSDDGTPMHQRRCLRHQSAFSSTVEVGGMPPDGNAA